MCAAPALLAPRGGGDTRLVVGIGEFAVTRQPGASIVTHALGSCIAVCIWDPAARVAGLLHFLLPDSKINPERARVQVGTFADSGIPALFQEAYKLGLDKKRCEVRLAGGAEIAASASPSNLQVGKRNILAARNLLWRNGVMIRAEATGGAIPRTVRISVDDGRVEVSTGRDIALL